MAKPHSDAKKAYMRKYMKAKRAREAARKNPILPNWIPRWLRLEDVPES